MSKVSVVIPSYNCVKYLPSAIDSVLEQTYKDFEIVVIDDGSTDNTREVVEKYTRKYSEKVKYFYQSNKGPGSTRNRGIREAKGNYIAFLDSDDYFLPEFLEKCLVYLKKHNWDFITPRCLYRKVPDSRNKYKLVKIVRDALPESPRELYKYLIQKHVSAQTMLVHRECFKRVQYCSDYTYAEDWDMWLKLVEAGFRPGLVLEDKPLWVYLVRKGSLWNSSSSEKKKWMGDYIVLKRHKKAAFARDLSLRKVYAEKLVEISKNIFHLKNNKFLAIKILLESQVCHFNLKMIGALIDSAIKKTVKI